MAKTKKVIKAIADQVSGTSKNSTVRFVVEETGPANEDGTQGPRTARTVIQIVFSEAKSGVLYEPGKEYSITIE